MELFNVLPRSTVPFLIGIFVWFASNFVVVTPWIYGRMMLPYREQAMKEVLLEGELRGVEISQRSASKFVGCVYAKPMEGFANRLNFAVYFSSFGLIVFDRISGNSLPDRVREAAQSGECGEVPWKT